jgi:hypothetical protein
MNEVDITLRATAYLQAQPGGDMQLFVVDGTATVESDGISHTVIPGTSLRVPLDQNGAASGPPTEPEPYDAEQLVALPTTLLPNPVEIPPPLDQPTGLPVNGQWTFRWSVEEMTCENGETVAFTADASTATITAAEDGSSITLLLTRYNRVDTGVYDAVFADATGNLHRHTLTVTSLDRIAGQAEIEYVDIGCSLVVPFTLSLVEAT